MHSTLRDAHTNATGLGMLFDLAVVIGVAIIFPRMMGKMGVVDMYKRELQTSDSIEIIDNFS